jgi:ribosome-binding factor A
MGRPCRTNASIPGSGPSQRQLRVGELIRRTLSDVLNRAEIHDPELNAMSITVGEVSCSPDLKVATVYVMPLMGSVPVEAAIAALARNKAELRHRVGSGTDAEIRPRPAVSPGRDLRPAGRDPALFSDPAVQRDLDAADDE